MRYFLDAEFNGFGSDLISIALVPEEPSLPPFYEAIECSMPTGWVKDYVLPVLQKKPMPRGAVADHFAFYLIDDRKTSVRRI